MQAVEKDSIKRVLVITLSNVGDIILTTPVIETLLDNFPGAELDVVVGPRGKDIFKSHEGIRNVIVYDKKVSLADKLRFFLRLKKENYNLVADMRNTIFPFLLRPRYSTNFFRVHSKKNMHKKKIHLSRLEDFGLDVSKSDLYIAVGEEDKKSVNQIIEKLNSKPYVVASPGAKSHIKRWPHDKFAALCDMINRELGYEVVLIGDGNDEAVMQKVLSFMKTKPLDLLGKTNIRELACLIGKSRLLVTNDSAPVHVGSAVGASILAFFGPTDEKKYGPVTKAASTVLRKKLDCAPCEVAECANKENPEGCLRDITVDEAFRAVRKLLEDRH